MNGIFCSVIDPGLHAILIPALFCFSFVAFLWAVFYYALAGEYDEYAREMSKGLMLWGIMAFIIMVIVWEIINLVYGWIGVGSAMC